MNIVLLGAPASGKGTQAKKIAQKFNLLHISTGELLREMIKQNNHLSKEIQSYVQTGRLVPDSLIIDILKKFLKNNNKQNGILFDGFPRTLNQALALEGIVKVDYCFEIDICLDSVIDRVSERWACSGCGKSYIMRKHNSKFCGVCGEPLIKRADDTKETAINRYNDYLKVKNNIVDYYKNQNTFYRIDGELSIDDTFDQICKIIKVWYT